MGNNRTQFPATLLDPAYHAEWLNDGAEQGQLLRFADREKRETRPDQCDKLSTQRRYVSGENAAHQGGKMIAGTTSQRREGTWVTHEEKDGRQRREPHLPHPAHWFQFGNQRVAAAASRSVPRGGGPVAVLGREKPTTGDEESG